MAKETQGMAPAALRSCSPNLRTEAHRAGHRSERCCSHASDSDRLRPSARFRASVCAKKSSKFNYEFERIYVHAGARPVDQELQIFLSDSGAQYIKCSLGDMNGIGFTKDSQSQ